MSTQPARRAYPLTYISGCNKQLHLTSMEPFRLTKGELRKCSTKALKEADSHATALASCNGCSAAMQPSYIEPPHPDVVKRPDEKLGGRETVHEIVSPVQGPDKDDPYAAFTQMELGANPDAQVKIADPSIVDPDTWRAIFPASVGEPYQPQPKPTADEPPPAAEEVAVYLDPAKQEQERTAKGEYEPIVGEGDIRSATPIPMPATPPKYASMAEWPPPSKGALVAQYPEVKQGRKPSIDELLQGVQGLESGPSAHGMSRLKTARLCKRFYFWEVVMGMRAIPPRDFKILIDGEPLDTSDDRPARLNPLWVGSLCHAVRAFHLQTGGRYTWEPLYQIRGLYPEYALEVYRLMSGYYDRWIDHDARTWDTRAVEVEGRYFFPSRRIGGRGRRLCLSSRYDAIYRPLATGEARTPLGEPTAGCRINELKSAARTTAYRGLGYRINPQIQLQAATYSMGNLVTRDGVVLPESPADVFGPLMDIEVDWIIKVKHVDPNKHLVRKSFAVPTEQREHFLKTTGDFYIEEIGKRLWHKAWDNPDTWPQSWMCHDMYYQGWICPFAKLCEEPSRIKALDQTYQVGNLGPLDRDSIVRAKKLGRRKRAKKRKATATAVDGK